MSQIKLETLLESGVHFGHQVHRWNPKMRFFIYGQKGGVHIFDLSKTVKYLENALDFVAKLSKEGKIILFVGTKRQVQDIIKEEAKKAGCPYINKRWLGGTLTNFITIKKQIKKLNNLEEEQKAGGWNNMIKKERLYLEKDLEKLRNNIAGLKNLKDLPDALFITDVNRDYLAVEEAKKLGIPIIAICDTNSDPTGIDYIIPANDDAIRSLRLIISNIADVIIKNKSITKLDKNNLSEKNDKLNDKLEEDFKKSIKENN